LRPEKGEKQGLGQTKSDLGRKPAKSLAEKSKQKLTR
jgi:hypothetical protein